MELSNKIVVITGGSKGLGKALAVSFIKEGSKVIISSRKKDELENTAKEIGATAIVADVTKGQEMKNLVDEVVKIFGRIDIWINNAGVWIHTSMAEDVDSKRFHDILEVNLFGVVYGSKFSLAQMKKQQEGTIVTILSTAGLEGKKYSSAYCSSKFAADGFMKSLRAENENTNIKVLNVYPGGIQTDFWREEMPPNISEYMNRETVTEKIISNLKQENPESNLIIKRPK